MIRINAVKTSVVPIKSGSRDVKEDLKRNSLHPLKKYQSNWIVREQQIYGLTCICGNKAVTLPILKNLRAASEKTKSTHGKIW
jgi:hypothetical protein